MANPIMQLLQNNILTGDNFPKWKANLNIVLISENIRNVLTDEIMVEPPCSSIAEVRKNYDRWLTANNKAVGYLLVSISDALRLKVEGKKMLQETLWNVFKACSEKQESKLDMRLSRNTSTLE